MAMNNRSLSPAGMALFGNTGVADQFGLGDQLRQQTGDELEEERKKRALGLSVLSPGQSGGSPAIRALMGGMGMGGFLGGTMGR
jgi:hypothetical protein